MIVSSKVVEDNEDYGRTINHFFDLFALPILKERNLKFRIRANDRRSGFEQRF